MSDKGTLIVLAAKTSLSESRSATTAGKRPRLPVQIVLSALNVNAEICCEWRWCVVGSAKWRAPTKMNHSANTRSKRISSCTSDGQLAPSSNAQMRARNCKWWTSHGCSVGAKLRTRGSMAYATACNRQKLRKTNCGTAAADHVTSAWVFDGVHERWPWAAASPSKEDV